MKMKLEMITLVKMKAMKILQNMNQHQRLKIMAKPLRIPVPKMKITTMKNVTIEVLHYNTYPVNPVVSVVICTLYARRAIQVMLNRPVGSLPQSTAAQSSRPYSAKVSHLHIGGLQEGLKTSKKYVNRVKQCCKVCKKPVCSKHSPKTSRVTCNNQTDH